MDAPPPAPEAPGPVDITAGERLALIAWADVPIEISSELLYLLAYRCRKHPRPCFCGCHRGSEVCSQHTEA